MNQNNNPQRFLLPPFPDALCDSFSVEGSSWENPQRLIGFPDKPESQGGFPGPAFQPDFMAVSVVTTEVRCPERPQRSLRMRLWFPGVIFRCGQPPYRLCCTAGDKAGFSCLQEGLNTFVPIKLEFKQHETWPNYSNPDSTKKQCCRSHAHQAGDFQRGCRSYECSDAEAQEEWYRSARVERNNERGRKHGSGGGTQRAAPLRQCCLWRGCLIHN